MRNEECTSNWETYSQLLLLVGRLVACMCLRLERLLSITLPSLECLFFIAPQRYNLGRDPSLESLLRVLRDVSYKLMTIPRYDCHPFMGNETR